MSQKFLSPVALTGITDGSILKVNSSGVIVAAVDGTDYNIGSSQWTTSGNDIYYTTGNVGIGETSPDGLLHIKGSAQATEFHIESSTGTASTSGAIKIAQNNRSAESLAGEMVFYVQDNNVGGTYWREAMTIINNGNVGIGNSAPGNNRLKVTGATEITGAVTLSNFGAGFLKTDASGAVSVDTSTYLTSYTETDPIYTASSWYSTTNNASNWDTAFGWGNHAGLYASTSHTHSVFTQATSDIVGGEEAIVPGANGFVPASGLNDGVKFLRGDGTWQTVATDLTGYATETWVGQQGYLTSFTESDPVFTQSDAYNIRAEDITNWNTAYGWGDHSEAGYLTSIPTPVNGDWWNNGVVTVSTDGVMEMGKYMDFHTSDNGGNVDYDLRVTVSPGMFSVGGDVYATGGNSTQWNTAYGWGNHAGLYVPKTWNFLESNNHGYCAYDNICGWRKIASVTINGTCQTLKLWGFYRDLGYTDTGRYDIEIVARGECDFSENNDSHHIYATIVAATSHTSNITDKVRVVLVGSDENRRDYEVQFYRESWDNGYWQLQNEGGWNVWSDHQDPADSLGDGNVHYTSKVLANEVYMNGNLVATQSWVGSQGYLTSFTETDPIYTASSWYTTTNNASSWDTAYGWGNHAAQGYLTSETDSQTLSWEQGEKTLTISNGNTVTLDGLATEDFVTGQGYITGYTEADTLATVTARGASTSTRTTFTEVGVSRNGADTLGDGPWFRWTNYTEDRQMLTQLNASNGLTTWAYNGTSWSNIYTLTQGGNVGIGTTSPGAKLDVDGSIRLSTSGTVEGRGYPYTTNIGSGANATTTNIRAGSTYKSEISLIGGDVGDRIEFKTNSTERMRITSAGNVGIGTTNPGNRRLVVSQSTNDEWIAGFVSTGTSPYGLYIDTGANSSTTYSFATYTNAGTGFFIRNNGLVGIGTNNPDDKLHVIGNARFSGSASDQHIKIMYGSGASDYGAIRFYQNGSNQTTIHSFSTAWQSNDPLVSGGSLNLTGTTATTIGDWNDPDIVVRNGGATYIKNNVGIGTTSPTQKLQVSGNIDATGVISQTFWTNDSIRKLNANDSLNFRTAAGPIEMVLDGSGNLVVGTTLINTSNGAKVFGLKSESGKYFTQNSFGQDGGYTWPSTTYVTGNDNSPIGNTTFRGNGAFQGHVEAAYVPIDATKTYKVSVWMRAVTGSPYCYLSHRQYYFDYSNGNPGNGGWGNPYWWNGTPSSSWTEYSMTIGPDGSGADYTHMEGVKFIQHGWLHNYTSDGSATAEFQGWKIEELDSTLASDVTVMGNPVATQTWVTSQGYLTSETDSQTLDWNQGEKTLTISNGNSVDLGQMASIQDVENYGYITGESDTLATVTGRGSSTSTTLSLGGGYNVPDGITNYGSHFQTNDYTTMTFFSRAWASVQGTNGLAYSFNTHSNAGGGGYQALQIYYGESGYVYAPTSFRAPSFHGDSIKIGIAGSTPTVDYGIFHQSGVGLGIASGAGSSTQGIDFWSHNGSGFFQSVRIAGLTGNVGIGTTLPVGKLQVEGGINQSNIIGRPKAYWGAGGNSNGAVIISFPGGFSNYGMVHAVVDIYEYNSSNVSTVIIGGHNWNGRWYAYGANTVGYTDKQIRVSYKDGRYAIVIGDENSSWSYGQVVLRKIQNGNYYAGVMNVSDGYDITQTQDLSSDWMSENLAGLKTNGNLTVNGEITASGYNKANWDTAYGWGNHASANYWITSDSAPQIVSAGSVTFQFDVEVQGQLLETSSLRYKENIVDLEPVSDKVSQLRPVRYNKIGNDQQEIGLIAEEVAELFPEVVHYNDNGEPDSLNYTRLSVLLLQTVKELSDRIQKLENK